MASLPAESSPIATSPLRPPGSGQTHHSQPPQAQAHDAPARGSSFGTGPVSTISPPGSSPGSVSVAGSGPVAPGSSSAATAAAAAAAATNNNSNSNNNNISSTVPRGLPLDASQLKLTRGHSCVLCQTRKVRCDKKKPCANCVKASVECRVVPPHPPRRRKKRPHERELIDRLRKYEVLLSQHGVAFDPIAQDLRPSDVASTLDEVDELEQNLGGLKTSPGSHNSDPQREREYKWFPYYKEDAPDTQHLLTRAWPHYKPSDDEVKESSDEEGEGNTIHNAFDKMFDNQDGFPFVIGGGTAMATVTDKHPPGIQIIQLWQIYLNNVNPLLKLTHTPSLQGQIIEAGTNPAKIPKPLEALLFSIYLIAITSMQDDEVHCTFGEEKSHLLGKYHAGAQQALLNAGFMRSSELMVLQAYLMYLLSVRQYVDPRSMFCLIGIAVRVAQRLGIHRDGEQFKLPPFEVEMRRRLWYQLAAFDKRIAEITGSSITALSSSHSDCKWPLNINDTDLHIHSKDFPPTSAGPTEMIFVLSRIEMITAAPMNALHAPNNIGNRSKFHYSPAPSSPDLLSHMANQSLPGRDLDGFCRYMEDAYLKLCDRKIPLHFFALMFTQQNLCRLRVIAFLCRTAAGIPNEEGERDSLFHEAIRMVEYDNVIQAADSLRGFLWYTRMYFPLPGYMFLVHELRARRTGPMVEKAWEAIIENHDRRGLMNNLRSPVHLAFGNLFLKAWDARQTAEAQMGRTIATPKFINVLRQNLSKQSDKPTMPMPSGPGNFARTPQPPQDSQQHQQQQEQQQHHHQQQNRHQQQQQHQTPQQHQMPQQHTQQQQTPDTTPSLSTSDGSAGGGVMVVDEAGMFAGFDGVNQFFGDDGGADPGGQQQVTDLDFGQMDWISMMPEISSFVVGGLNHHNPMGPGGVAGPGMGMGGGGASGMGMPSITAVLPPLQQQQQPQPQPQHQHQHHQSPRQRHQQPPQAPPAQDLPHPLHQHQRHQQHTHLPIPQQQYHMRHQQLSQQQHALPGHRWGPGP